MLFLNWQHYHSRQILTMSCANGPMDMKKLHNISPDQFLFGLCECPVNLEAFLLLPLWSSWSESNTFKSHPTTVPNFRAVPSELGRKSNSHEALHEILPIPCRAIPLSSQQNPPKNILDCADAYRGTREQSRKWASTANKAAECRQAEPRSKLKTAQRRATDPNGHSWTKSSVTKRGIEVAPSLSINTVRRKVHEQISLSVKARHCSPDRERDGAGGWPTPKLNPHGEE